jgi:protein O-mannosyl-transferase
LFAVVSGFCRKTLKSRQRDRYTLRMTPVKRRKPSSAARRDESAAEEGGDAAWFRSPAMKDAIFAAALLLVVLLAYQPAWHGGLVWDDDAHVTAPALRSWHGLYRIWFEVGATLQYYPFVHSVFWIEHKLWGDATLGYHLVNIFLHVAAAVMVAAILRRLAIPGAYLAAAIFALHPVQVESVAWITELKNTLSGVFYLAAALLYFRFDRTRKTDWYLSALGFFLLALLTKTVTGTLPGALLVIFWWQRGRLSWDRDVLPLAPFFLLGAGLGMFTAWWELKLNHCDGPEFELTRIARVLIAGRVVWFQLGKLFWPVDLTFIYPRWNIDAGDWQQYLYPLGAAALLAAAWTIRKWSRAPLAALLYFGGTLFPVLGFFNLYTYRYSFVADHYQYLACLGIIAWFSAEAAMLWQVFEGRRRVIAQAACVAMVSLLASLTWKQSAEYADVQTLFRQTIALNPGCWMAYTNLGNSLAGQGRFDDAIVQYEQAVQIKSGDAETRYNFANALAARGRVEDAITQYQECLRIRPDFVAARFNLGLALDGRGQIDDAIKQYERAVDIDPKFAAGHVNLGIALARRDRVTEAIEHFQKALAINPDYAEAHFNLAVALARGGQIDAAIEQFQKALALRRDYADAQFSLAVLFASSGRAGEALEHYQAALRLASARHDQAQAGLIRDRIRALQTPVPGGKRP